MNSNTKYKYVLIMAVVIMAVFFIASNINKKNVSVVKETPATSMDDYFKMTDSANKYFEDKIKTNYSKEGFDFNTIYDYASSTDADNYLDIKSGNYNINVTTNKDFDDQDINNENYYEIKLLNRNKSISSEKFYYEKPIGIYQIKYSKNKILTIIQDWSGGAHCCFSLRTVLSDDNNVFFSGNLSRGDSDLVTKDSFFVKNGQLYFYTYDTGFAYFESSFVESKAAFIPVIYKIDELGNFVLAVDEFKDIYRGMAKISTETINEAQSKSDNSVNKKMFLQRLIYWLQVSLISSNDDVWSQFEAYYNNFIGDDKYEAIRQEMTLKTYYGAQKTNLAISSDKKSLAVHKDAFKGDITLSELWFRDVKTGKEDLLIKSGPTESLNLVDAPDEISGIYSAVFSGDGKTLYFTDQLAYVTSGAVYSINLETKKINFISGTNYLDIVKTGKYKDFLILNKHKYIPGGGSYDRYYAVNPNTGEEVRDIGNNLENFDGLSWDDALLNLKVPAKFSDLCGFMADNCNGLTYKNGKLISTSDNASLSLLMDGAVAGRVNGTNIIVAPYNWVWASGGYGVYVIKNDNNKLEIIARIESGKEIPEILNVYEDKIYFDKFKDDKRSRVSCLFKNNKLSNEFLSCEEEEY